MLRGGNAMFDKEKFIRYIAEDMYEDYSEWNGSDQVYGMDEVHDIGLTYPIARGMTIEDLGDWEYWTFYNQFLNRNQDLVGLINEEISEIISDNYDPYWDDLATYHRMVFG